MVQITFKIKRKVWFWALRHVSKQGVFWQYLVTLIERLKIVCPEGFCKKFASNLLERPYLGGVSVISRHPTVEDLCKGHCHSFKLIGRTCLNWKKSLVQVSRWIYFTCKSRSLCFRALMALAISIFVTTKWFWSWS